MKLDVIGQRLRRVRKLIDVSRGEIERKYNISANTIKTWESGKAEIGVIRLVNYLKIFENYGVFLSMDRFLDFRTNNYLEEVMMPHGNNSIYGSTRMDGFQNLKNAKELQLISDTITSTIGFILERKEQMLQSLFDNLPFKIAFKDENNTILRLNNLAAQDLGGIVSDFEGKNVYNLFPQKAKKYHEVDLEVFKSSKPITIDEEITPINSVSSKMISVSRTPIFNGENKKMVFVTFRDIVHTNQV